MQCGCIHLSDMSTAATISDLIEVLTTFSLLTPLLNQRLFNFTEIFRELLVCIKLDCICIVCA